MSIKTQTDVVLEIKTRVMKSGYIANYMMQLTAGKTPIGFKHYYGDLYKAISRIDADFINITVVFEDGTYLYCDDIITTVEEYR